MPSVISEIHIALIFTMITLDVGWAAQRGNKAF